METLKKPSVKEIIAKKVNYFWAQFISKDFAAEANFETELDIMMQRWINTIRITMLGRDIQESVVDTFKYPTTWWDHFKERFFPAFILKHFPVNYTEKTVVAKHVHVCPHLPANHRGQNFHLAFLAGYEGVPELHEMPMLTKIQDLITWHRVKIYSEPQEICLHPKDYQTLIEEMIPHTWMPIGTGVLKVFGIEVKYDTQVREGEIRF